MIDKRLMSDDPKLKAMLEKQERRGYTIKIVDIEALLGPNMTLLLSPAASWWDTKMWAMLELKLRGREAEAKK